MLIKLDDHRPGRPPGREGNSPAERRYLSVLFCDLVDSAGHLHRLGDEAYYYVLAAYLGSVETAVARHGGMVARVVGDGVLAYFGWPQSTGRDAQAAVACALEISTTVSSLRADDLLAVRVAIETGWVLIGGPSLGPDQWPAIGAAANVAARLQSLARPNGVIAGADTLALLGGRFHIEPADTTGIKLPGNVAAAHVLGEAGVGHPIRRLIRNQADPAKACRRPVGRDAELAIMHARWRAACDNAGQVILLSGEPGIGKSHLLGTLLTDLGIVRGVVPLFCSRTGRDTPFRPVTENLRIAMGLTGNNSQTVVQKRAAEFTRGLGLSEPKCAAALAALLDAPMPDTPAPDELRELIQATLLALVDQLTRERPVVVLAEDVHWADASTLELLRKLGDRLETRKLLLLVTYRSDFVLPWADRANVLRMSLGPLARGEAHRLAAELAQEEHLALDAAQEAQIVARAEGVPFFIEEFVRAIAQGNVPLSDLPGSVSQLLMARLDALGPARPLAHLIAVIGLDARLELIQALTDVSAKEFADALNCLVSYGVITSRGTGRDAVLAFRHALLGDAAYQALPQARRRYLHGLVADTMRRLTPSIESTDPETLAHHLAKAERHGEAVFLYAAAARAALSAAAFIEAEAHARRGLTLTDVLSDSTRSDALLAVLTPLGEALSAIRGEADHEVFEIQERGARLALDRGSPTEILPFLRGLGGFYIVHGPIARAYPFCERVLQIASRLGPPSVIAQAERRYGWCQMCLGDLAGARASMQSALIRHARANASANPDGQYSAAYEDAYTLAHLAWLDWLTDGSEAASARAALAVARADASPRPMTTAYALGITSMVCQMIGEGRKATELAERSGAVAANCGFSYWTALAAAVSSWAKVVGGGSKEALHELRQALAAYQRTQATIFHPYLLALTADAEQAVGIYDSALDSLRLAERSAKATGARFFQPMIQLARGRVLAAAGAREAAVRSLLLAREEALGQGAYALAATALALAGSAVPADAI